MANWTFHFLTKRFTFCREAHKIFALPTDCHELSFEDWKSMVHEEDRESTAKIMEQLNEHSKHHSLHFRIIVNDGEERHVYMEYDFNYVSEKMSQLLSGKVYDITEIKKIKYELIHSEENIRLIMDLIPLSIYARDIDGNYLFANNVFMKHYGINPAELKNKNIKDFVNSPEELEELIRQDQFVLSSDEKLFVAEFKQTNKEGILKAWRIIKVPFTPKGKSQKAVLGIAEDITDRKMYEENLVEMTNSLSARNQELEMFSQMVSHDLRGPLSTLMGIHEVIDNVKLSQEDVAAFIAGIKSSLLKIDAIIRDLNEITSVKRNEDYI